VTFLLTSLPLRGINAAMKLHILSIIVLGLVASAAIAEEKVTLSGVHNCCKKCTEGLNKAVATAPGVTAKIDKSTVALTGGSTEDLQKAVDAIVAAGYTGTSDNDKVKVNAGEGADEKVTSLTVSGTHLCCGKCVTATDKAVKSVAGVKSDTAAKGAESFKVEGDFNAKEVMAALDKAGFTGKAAK
jgi:copper chaperone CopZ